MRCLCVVVCVVQVSSLADGNVNIEELKQKAEQHKDKLAALMITYPSTHGRLGEGVRVMRQGMKGLGKRTEQHKDKLAMLMLTYPATPGTMGGLPKVQQRKTHCCEPALPDMHLHPDLFALQVCMRTVWTRSAASSTRTAARCTWTAPT